MVSGSLKSKKKGAFSAKGLHMIRETSERQLALKDFIHPFGCKLNAGNRWVRLAEVIPWEALSAPYKNRMSANQGRPGKPARLVIGALIIKHKLNLSDEETVLQIQENHYLQFFCGFGEYMDTPPFVPSLFVEIRKRMGVEVFEAFEQAIVDQAVRLQKRKRASTGSGDADRDDPPPSSSPDRPSKGAEKPAHHGRLLMDATVADQMIRFPTDLSLLNESREISERLIDELHKQTEGKKPRTYRIRARKDFLAISKRKRVGKQLRRKGIRQQLQYLRRNLGHIERMLNQLMPEPGMLFPLKHKHQRQYWIIQQVYVQQRRMYEARVKRCDNRIVSISQPHVRPIVRGKAGKNVEFGSKVSVSMLGKLAFVDHLSWDAFNESQDLIGQVEHYRQRFGFYPEVVLADGIYGTQKNRRWLKDRSIRYGGKPLGRPKKLTEANIEEIKQQRQQRRMDERSRIPIEGKFGQGKNGYRLNQIRARLASTSEAWVRSIFLVMNLMVLLRFLLPWLRIRRDNSMVRRVTEGIRRLMVQLCRQMMIAMPVKPAMPCRT